jgi:hypothetical protein
MAVAVAGLCEGPALVVSARADKRRSPLLEDMRLQ